MDTINDLRKWEKGKHHAFWIGINRIATVEKTSEGYEWQLDGNTLINGVEKSLSKAKGMAVSAFEQQKAAAKSFLKKISE